MAASLLFTFRMSKCHACLTHLAARSFLPICLELPAASWTMSKYEEQGVRAGERPESGSRNATFSPRWKSARHWQASSAPFARFTGALVRVSLGVQAAVATSK
ncbi:hypothetical protein BDV98DRAFT_573883 [Pterulicium gracile]|uniref:Secreted protein n=1 Tax=Pterulicium gracile TaxID=1884261 RepID=A0A5C3QCD3_9AGAR|nr:hypothetical protein BDV98DRAFT_573883 [Pterula gracilis]